MKRKYDINTKANKRTDTTYSDTFTFHDFLKILDDDKDKIVIQTEIRKYNKPVTIIKGLNNNNLIISLTRKLKQDIGVGGTSKNNTIILQGNHKEEVKKILLSKGFKDEMLLML